MKSRVGVCSMPMSHGACPNRTHVVCTSMSPDSAVASTACQTCEIVREILSVKKADIRPTSCGPGSDLHAQCHGHGVVRGCASYWRSSIHIRFQKRNVFGLVPPGAAQPQ